MNGEMIVEDVKKILFTDELKPGLVILDISVLFPFANQNIFRLHVGLSDDMDSKERFEDIVFNHRYANHHYLTMSKKNGRRVSKSGYPINDTVSALNGKKYLLIDFGIGNSEKIHIVVPVTFLLSESAPAAGLSLYLDMHNPNYPEFVVHVHKPEVNELLPTYWKAFHYHSVMKSNFNENDIFLEIDGEKTDEKAHKVVYSTEILVPGSKITDILLY